LWDGEGYMAWSPAQKKDLKTVRGGERHAERKKRGNYGKKSGRERAA